MASTSALVQDLQNSVDSLKSGVSAQAQKVHSALNQIDVTVNGVNKKMTDLRQMIIEGEEKQLAHENVLKIEQQISEQLRNYQTTRRSVLGVIKDFDINLARGSTISRLSEELWMSTSRYWLSYAFIAISAWVQDNKELCMNAVSEAMRRDAINSSLFFCLLNLRFGEHISAREWLYEYFGAVDSMHPPRETALLIQAYLYGVFGKDSQLDSFMQATMDRWVSEMESDPAISSEISEDYGKYIQTLPVQKDKFKGESLINYCSNYDELQAALNKASRYGNAKKRISELENVPDVKGSGDFVAKVDKVLDDLVTNYDEEEIKLRNEQKFYKLIMEHEGNVEAAKKQYEAYMETVKDAPNISKQMFRWAVYPDGIDLSVQKFAMQKTKGWYKEALYAYDRDIKNSAPTTFKLNIDMWSEATDAKDREAVKKSVHDKFMAERAKTIIFTKPNIVLTVLAFVLLVVGCAFGMICQSADLAFGMYGYIAGAGLFVVFAAIVGTMTGLRLKAYPKRIEKAQNILSGCLDEIDAYREILNKEYDVRDEVIKTLEYL